MNDSINKNQVKILLTNQCTNECNVNVEARRIKDKNRKTIDRRNRTNDQIVDDKLKDRLQKRKEKCQRTDAKNEIHRIKNRAAVMRCRKEMRRSLSSRRCFTKIFAKMCLFECKNR